MRLERSRNAKRNIIFGVINKSATTFLPFVLRTVIIYVIGAQYLGLDSLFSSILKVLSLTELGFAHAVVYSMYKPIAENDMDTLSALLYFFRKVYRIIGTVILLVGLALLWFVPYLIKDGYPADINIYVLYLMFLLNTCLSYFLFGYKTSLLNAYQRVDVSSKINTLVMIGCYAAQILVIFLTRNYYVYILVMLLATVVNNLCTAYFTKKLFPHILPHGVLSKERRAVVTEKVKGLMLNKICGTSRNAFDSIFMSAFMGLTQTAIYNNYYYITNAVTSFMTIADSSLLGGVGNSIEMESEEKNYRDMNKFNFIYMWIGGWFTVCLLCLVQPFTQLVWGKDMMFSFGIVITFCLYFYTLKMGDIRYTYSSACGLWWENRYRAITEAVANILLNFFLGKYFGAFGIVLATLLSLFVFNFLWGSTIIFRHYFKHQKMSEYFSQHAFYAAVTFGICVLTWYLCSQITGPLVLILLLRALVCLVLPNMIYLIVYRRYGLYREAIPWLLGVLKLDRNHPVYRLMVPRDLR
ncbi:MAG: hypothetical protein Q4B73_09230 [Lachnospiraceae bacterium]|nr:hypothetical protein [Lachnospiraceae bacterium]